MTEVCMCGVCVQGWGEGGGGGCAGGGGGEGGCCGRGSEHILTFVHLQNRVAKLEWRYRRVHARGTDQCDTAATTSCPLPGSEGRVA